MILENAIKHLFKKFCFVTCPLFKGLKIKGKYIIFFIDEMRREEGES